MLKSNTNTCLLLPGLDAVFSAKELKKWVSKDFIQKWLIKSSNILSEKSKQKEDLLNFTQSHHRPHLIDFDRTLIILTTLQVAISNEVSKKVDYSLIQGCSHGDIARSVLCESISFETAIDILWFFSQLRKNAPSGFTANVRTLDKSPLVQCQTQWLEESGAPVSRWSETHATIGGDKELIQKLISMAPLKNLKIKPILPYPIHSPTMQLSFEELTKNLHRWPVHPPNHELFSSLWLKPLKTKEEVIQEGLAGAITPVQWVGTLEHLYFQKNIQHFVNIGPSNTLTSWMLNHSKYKNLMVTDAYDVLNVTTHEVKHKLTPQNETSL